MPTEKILAKERKVVTIASLKHHPHNPRTRKSHRDLEDSLKTNGQYRPLIVQRSTGYVLAGNQTLRAAKNLKWRKIEVDYVDVSDDAAAKIVVVDNRSNELGEIDPEILKIILSEAGDPSGTGYTEDEYALLVSMAEDAAMEAVEAAFIADDENANPFSQEPDDPIFTPQTAPEEDGGFSFNRVSDSLGGAYELRDEMDFPRHGMYGLPSIRADMLVQDLPSPLKTWAGTASKEDPDHEQSWWFFNYGPDSTSGMRNPHMMVLAFYVHDNFIEPWWWYPARHMTKVLNTKIQYAVTPNFSMSQMPGVQSLWQLFRSRWLGRYFQEIGVRVIPDFETGDEDWITDEVLATLPHEIPWMAVQVQNLVGRSAMGASTDDVEQKALTVWQHNLTRLLTTIEVGGLVAYGTDKGQERLSDLIDKIGTKTPVVALRERIGIRREHSAARAAEKGGGL